VPVLQSTGAGIELRTGSSSMMLLHRPGAVANQTVSAAGEIRVRYVDSETGAVTINNVSLE
jgi:Cu/Ag efflux protein CusF